MARKRLHEDQDFGEPKILSGVKKQIAMQLELATRTIATVTLQLFRRKNVKPSLVKFIQSKDF